MTVQILSLYVDGARCSYALQSVDIRGRQTRLLLSCVLFSPFTWSVLYTLHEGSSLIIAYVAHSGT